MKLELTLEAVDWMLGEVREKLVAQPLSPKWLVHRERLSLLRERLALDPFLPETVEEHRRYLAFVLLAHLPLPESLLHLRQAITELQLLGFTEFGLAASGGPFGGEITGKDFE